MLVKNKVIIEETEKNMGFDKYEIEQLIKPKPNKNFVKLWIYNLRTPDFIDKKEKEKKEKCKNRKSQKITSITKKIKKHEKKIIQGNDKKTKRLSKKIKNLQNKKETKENQKKESCNKQHFCRKKGEAPVVFSLNDKYRNKRKIRVFLKNKGYYTPNVKIEIIEKGDKKINVKYTISPGQVYKINNVSFNIEDSVIEKIIISDKKNSLLQKEDRLDTQTIENERKRISSKLRDIGYYTFSKDYIFFSIDTIGKNKHADIKINIIDRYNEAGKKIKNKKHIIQNIYIYPNFKQNEALINKNSYFQNQDTIIFYAKNNKKYHLIYKKYPRINPKSIVRGLYIVPGDFFNLEKIKTSYKYLASLQIIQTANINFKETNILNNNADSVNFIDCEIRLSQDKLQSYDLSAEFTNTSGNIGIAGNLNYTHNNFFRNTEVLDLKLNYELKRLTKNPNYELPAPTQLFNSKKYGAEISLKFPRIAAPHFIKKLFPRSNPKSILSSNFSITDRPDYSWSGAGGSWGYQWNTTSTVKHSFGLISADFFKVNHNYEEHTLDESYEDRFIFGSSYKFNFNNQLTRKRKNYFFITAYGKAAGNSLVLGKKILKTETEDGTYTIGGNTFAQFLKADIDFRYYRKLDRAKDNLVFRLYTGVAFPYGNLNVVPFSEQYFSGGANGIRAWDERSIGPGSYIEPNQDTILYYNQRSDIKLEVNFEYRVKLFGKFEGALFIDAGNIWAINEEDERKGAIFELSDFYKEIAIGSGLGLRIDLSIVIIRIDIGVKVKKTAALPGNNIWITPNQFFDFNNMKLNIGIGYPF